MLHFFFFFFSFSLFFVGGKGGKRSVACFFTFAGSMLGISRRAFYWFISVFKMRIVCSFSPLFFLQGGVYPILRLSGIWQGMRISAMGRGHTVIAERMIEARDD